jgi:hypothetical protein
MVYTSTGSAEDQKHQPTYIKILYCIPTNMHFYFKLNGNIRATDLTKSVFKSIYNLIWIQKAHLYAISFHKVYILHSIQKAHIFIISFHKAKNTAW